MQKLIGQGVLLLYVAWLIGNFSDTAIKNDNLDGAIWYISSHYAKATEGCFFGMFEAMFANLVLVLTSFGSDPGLTGPMALVYAVQLLQ